MAMLPDVCIRQAITRLERKRDLRAVILADTPAREQDPLTLQTPAPLLPLFDKPLIEHQINLLKNHSVPEVIVALGEAAGRITEWLGSGERLGASIRYLFGQSASESAATLASAGDAPLTTLVVPASLLADAPIRQAFEAHRGSGAVATIIAPEAESEAAAMEDTTPEPCLSRRLVHPSQIGRLADVGMLLLEPQAVLLAGQLGLKDIRRDLLPRLISGPGGVWLYRARYASHSVKSASDYRQAHLELLAAGTFAPSGATRLSAGVCIGDGCHIHHTARICGPVYLGPGSRIGPNALIAGDIVICEGASVGASAKVEQSVVGRFSNLGDDCLLSGSVIGQYETVPPGEQIVDMASAGSNTMDLPHDRAPRLIEDVTTIVQRFARSQQAPDLAEEEYLRAA